MRINIQMNIEDRFDANQTLFWPIRKYENYSKLSEISKNNLDDWSKPRLFCKAINQEQSKDK